MSLLAVLILIDGLNNVWLLRKARMNTVMIPLHQRILWSYQIVVAQLSSQSAWAKPITNLISATDRQADRRIIRANTCEWQGSIIKHPGLSLVVTFFKKVNINSKTNGLFKTPKFYSSLTYYALGQLLKVPNCNCFFYLDAILTDWMDDGGNYLENPLLYILLNPYP